MESRSRVNSMHIARLVEIVLMDLVSSEQWRFCTAVMLHGRNNRFFFLWENVLSYATNFHCPAMQHGLLTKPLQLHNYSVSSLSSSVLFTGKRDFASLPTCLHCPHTGKVTRWRRDKSTSSLKLFSEEPQ